MYNLQRWPAFSSSPDLLFLACAAQINSPTQAIRINCYLKGFKCKLPDDNDSNRSMMYQPINHTKHTSILASRWPKRTDPDTRTYMNRTSIEETLFNLFDFCYNFSLSFIDIVHIAYIVLAIVCTFCSIKPKFSISYWDICICKEDLYGNSKHFTRKHTQRSVYRITRLKTNENNNQSLYEMAFNVITTESLQIIN